MGKSSLLFPGDWCLARVRVVMIPELSLLSSVQLKGTCLSNLRDPVLLEP